MTIREGDGSCIVAVWADPTSEAATTAGFDAAVAPAILHLDALHAAAAGVKS